MNRALKLDVVTIFPRMLDGVLGESILKRAIAAGHVSVRMINPRDFTSDTHRTVDDRPYGGGPGMVMKADPVFQAVESVREEKARVCLMTPQGRPFEQAYARELAGERQLIFVCGAYEGVDERIREALVTDEISIGDYVLTNGTLAAAVVIDAVTRLRPGVLGHEESATEESFADGLLEYPQYTRPPEYRGMKVPDILLSGHHEAVRIWRREQAEARTRQRRPDLWRAKNAAPEGGAEKE